MNVTDMLEAIYSQNLVSLIYGNPSMELLLSNEVI